MRETSGSARNRESGASAADGSDPAASWQPGPRLLLAQAVGRVAAADVRADAPAAPPAGATSAKATADSPPSGWQIPPLRWGGVLTADTRLSRSGDGPQRLQQYGTANIRGSSYIWQPWIAQVGGDLGLILGKLQEGTGEGLGDTGKRRTESSALTGGGEVALFPQSRFPFNAYFGSSDSRASGELTSEETTINRFGVRQSYRPVEPGSSYNAAFDRSTLESQSFGRDIVNALTAGMNWSADPQLLDLTGSHTSNERVRSGERTALGQINARHSYRPEGELSIDSLASASSSEFRLLSGGAPFNSRSRFAQASTFATWRPEDEAPYYFSGGARMFRSIIGNDAGEAQTLSLGGNVAATYSLSRQTSVSASATATQLVTEGGSRRLTSQSAFATHIADPVGILGWDYTWNAGTNVSNQTGLPDGTRQNLGGQLGQNLARSLGLSDGTRQNLGVQLGHNLARSLTLGEGSLATVGVGQTVGTSIDTVTASSSTLGHSANASLRVFRDAATSAYASLSGADSRTTGLHENHFQMVNLQLSGQVQIGRNATAAANLTVQGVRQSTPGATGAGLPINTSGSFIYSQQRVLDVPRLRYSARYSAAESQLRSRLQGNIDAPREQVVDHTFDQQLEYNIGRVAMRLSMRLARLEGRKDALIFFRMSRDFGRF